MPCYLFTWHAYGTWLPDRPQGYVHWSHGLQPQNVTLAQCYQREQKESSAVFDTSIQRLLIDQLELAAPLARFRLHAVATDSTHIHVLVSWNDPRNWKRLRRSIRHGLTTRLNEERRRTWFSRGGHAKQVESQQHFDQLVGAYLPNHKGWKWCETKGFHK